MNPFIISSYKSPAYFCDRNSETETICSSVDNNRNIVLTSLRRMGKTGLIHHVFNQLEQKNNHLLFYIDIQHTRNIDEFITTLVNGLLRAKKKSLAEKLFDFIKGFRPTVSFNSLTGNPEVEFGYTSLNQSKSTLESVLQYLDTLEKNVLIAIDEFQTITDYQEENAEAFLRAHIQHLNNINFIFSGSSTHLLQSMFYSHQRPFYQSADILHLERISEAVYVEFIIKHFSEQDKSIDAQLVKDCIRWCDGHTYYVQLLMNMLWGEGQEEITDTLIKNTKYSLLKSRDAVFANYKRLLGDKQYHVLKAIAQNQGVKKPNSAEFINKYKLGAASTVSSAINALQDKELLYFEKEQYKVYDVFLANWFQMEK